MIKRACFWTVLGLVLGISLGGNLPDHATNPPATIAGLLLVVFIVGRLTKRGTTIDVQASAEASAESSATAAVQVVLIPPGVDAQALAQVIGSRAYTVDAPAELVQAAAPAQLVDHDRAAAWDGT